MTKMSKSASAALVLAAVAGLAMPGMTPSLFRNNRSTGPSKSPEQEKELLAKAELKRERKKAKRLAQLQN